MSSPTVIDSWTMTWNCYESDENWIGEVVSNLTKIISFPWLWNEFSKNWFGIVQDILVYLWSMVNDGEDPNISVFNIRCVSSKLFC